MMTALERLKKRMEELNHSANKALGQNFLVSDHVIGKIVEATRVALSKLEKKSLIEIGPGLGAITDLLTKLDCQYQAIELDYSLFAYWQNAGLKVNHGDALQLDWSGFDSDILVSNLPYQISSSIVIEKSLEPFGLKYMILMFQKEVAQRIRALPQTEHYGMLSIIAQEFWTMETVCDAGPRDFSPPPKIASRVLQFVRKESDIVDRKKYLNFVKQCFHQRRRILRSNLPSKYSEAVTQWLIDNKLSEKARAEELSPPQLKKLYFSLNF
jgi:16S rRNA (adenine1518-N6/adenine1519-N6)-dimethyltransferase